MILTSSTLKKNNKLQLGNGMIIKKKIESRVILRHSSSLIVPLLKVGFGLTRTGLGLLFSRSLGKTYQAARFRLITRPEETNLKSVAAQNLVRFSGMGIKFAGNHLRNFFFNIARLIYTTILSFLSWLAVSVYNGFNALLETVSKLVLVYFNWGKGQLIHFLGGPLTDLQTIGYFIVYGLFLLVLCFIIIKMIDAVLYNFWQARAYVRAKLEIVSTHMLDLEKEGINSNNNKNNSRKR
jgi:hypothetical protein